MEPPISYLFELLVFWGMIRGLGSKATATIPRISWLALFSLVWSGEDGLEKCHRLKRPAVHFHTCLPLLAPCALLVWVKHESQLLIALNLISDSCGVLLYLAMGYSVLEEARHQLDRAPPHCSPGWLYQFTLPPVVSEFLLSHILGNIWCLQTLFFPIWWVWSGVSFLVLICMSSLLSIFSYVRWSFGFLLLWIHCSYLLA